MSTDQVNSSGEGSEFSQAEHISETPAETAYQALQAAEAQQADAEQDTGQTELPLESRQTTPTDDGARDTAPDASTDESTEGSAVAAAHEASAVSESADTADAADVTNAADAPDAAVTTEPTETPEAQSPEDGENGEDSEDSGESDNAQDPFAAFGSVTATSLMFHAPDTEAMKAAAERAAQAREDARQAAIEEAEAAAEAEFEDPEPGAGVTSKRRRRRRRGSVDMELEGGSDDDPPGTVTRIRTGRVVDGSAPTTVQSVKGSTRLEAKKQRRRESRQSGRRRQVITEAEFLARRESVERQMVVREKDDRIQIGVLEDGVLAEHFVSHTQQDSLIGNVYLGKVQNVLPSMEAAFVDIGRGRNAVLYAGEVNWDDADLGGGAKRIENALKPGDPVLVQVTKDPVGHKGARLTSQVSLPGRYLVYVPGGSMTGISRKLPDVERQRLKKILKDHLPDGAGVIVRTAAEGASEQELTNDINRLRSQWEQIQEKSNQGKTLAPEMLYAEPDLTIKTVRDVFNEDFTSMTVQGQAAWDNIEAYVTYVAPDLLDRVSQWTEDEDLFEHYKVDEQIYKALDRKVMLPSGGSLVIDRTEAMTVVDVNTGKFTGSGGNLEETVTKNNLEAAEEIVRQLRLRDIGGIIVIDFIDMVLEANRDLVLRRMVECLGRDRTKHQVAEVTSLGLVQMTRKRMGTGLLEIFSEPCEACEARGVVIHDHPLKGKGGASPETHRRDRNERKRSRRSGGSGSGQQNNQSTQNNGNGQSPEDPEQAKRAEATRNAFAAIASASHHDDGKETQRDHGSGKSSDRHETGKRDDAVNGVNADGAHESRDGDTTRNAGAGDKTDKGGRGEQHADREDSGSQGDDRQGGKRRRKRRGKRSRNRGQNEQADQAEQNEQADQIGETDQNASDQPADQDQDSDRGDSRGRRDQQKRRKRDSARDGANSDRSDDGRTDTERTGTKRRGNGSGPIGGAAKDSAEQEATDRAAHDTGDAAANGQAADARSTSDAASNQPGQVGRRRSRGARRAAAPVGTPEVAAQPVPAQSVKVTAGTASVGANGTEAAGSDADGSRVTINGQVIELPHGNAAPAANANGTGTSSLDSLADSLGERAPGEAAPRRQRRSRRASAPTAAPGRQDQAQ